MIIPDTSGGGGYSSAASVAITPAGTVTYNANAVVGGVLQFSQMAKSGGLIRLAGLALRIDDAVLIGSEGGYILRLYSASPPSAFTDNSPIDVPAGDRSVYLGSLSLGTPVDLGSTLQVEVDDAQKFLKLTGTDLFAYLVTLAGYARTANRVYNLSINAVGL